MEVNHRILCCECGTLIDPNPSNTCAPCLSKRTDITNEIQKEGVLKWCSKCDRFNAPPNNWYVCPPESKQLLALCLKKVKGLNRVRLVDACFVWTEEHSRRIKLKLTVQKEVSTGAILQQCCFVEFIQQAQQCEECNRVEAKDYWRACVQVRQDSHSKKAIYLLEQEILKHKLHLKMTNIKEQPGGLDFFYAEKQDARKMMDFVLSILPGRHHYAQELLSHDASSNIFTYKHTYFVEIVPLCKDDVVALPKKTAQKLGNLDQLCMVTKVGKIIHLICPLSGKIAEFDGTTFYKDPFKTVYIPKDFVEFIVIDVEPIIDNNLSKHCTLSKKHILCDVWVERSSEIGTGRTVHTRSHLGHILNPGDTVLGIDLSHSNVSSEVLEAIPDEDKPDVVLLKKVHHGKKKRKRGTGSRAYTESDMVSQYTAATSDRSSDDEETMEKESGKLADLFSSMFLQGNPSAMPIPEEGAAECVEGVAAESMEM